MTSPEFPLNIYVVITEFLAGSYAFGTLANFNIASHAIHEETLPVLYETVLQDKIEEERHCEVAELLFSDEPVPKRFTYTKFLICRPTGDLWFLDSYLKHDQTSFPMLSLIVTLDRGSDCIPYGCHLTLLKPLRTSTVFDVIVKTPIYHEPFEHQACQGTYDRNTRITSKAACNKESKKADVRPAERVRQMSITEHGWLLKGDAVPMQDDGWTTILKFRDTCVHSLTPNPTALGRQRHLDSVFEVLETIGYRRHPSVAKESLEIQPQCGVMDRYMDFNVAVVFDKEQFQAFIDKYAAVAPMFPEIIYTRLRIFLSDDFPSPEYLHETLGKLHTIYEAHSPSHTNATLLGHSSPYTLVDVRGPYYDPDYDDDRFSAFHDHIGGEESRRVQGYTGRIEMGVKGGAREFYVDVVGPEIYNEESEGYGSEEEFGSGDEEE